MGSVVGCAAPACHPVEETRVVVSPPHVVEHIVFVHSEPVLHSILLGDYQATLLQENALVARSKAPTIDRILSLNHAAQSAMRLLQDPDHPATVAEIRRAIAALGAIQVYLAQKH